MSPAQRNVLDAVRLLCDGGWTCSVREVAEVAGHASPSTTHAHLLRLERSGWVERNPNRPAGGWRPAMKAGMAL